MPLKVEILKHWEIYDLSIVGIVCRKAGKNIIESAEVYTIGCIALFDGFISCWDEK
jgi:hypothetical protein